MKRGILAAIVILGLPFLLQAQNQQNIETISLNRAIEIALQNNYQLKQAENNLEVAEEEVFSAKADFLPSVNASFGGDQTVGQQFNDILLRYEEQKTNTMRGSISANITVFDGFRNIMNLRRSQSNRRYQRTSLERTREQIIFTTASQFLQVLLDRELLQIARENLEASRQQMEQVKAQVDVGARPMVDLYNQESTVASNELTVIQRENTLELDRTRLIRTLQLDPLSDYQFELPEINEEDVSGAAYNLNSLTSQALANREDLKAQEFLVRTREYDLKISKANYYPSVTADAGVSSFYRDTYRARALDDQGNFILEKVSFSDQFFDQLVTRGIGFNVSIPIFNNWSTRMNVQRAQVNYRNAQLNLEDLRLGVQEEVRQAYNDYTSYTKQLDASQKALRASERNYETQLERYNVGASTLIELSDANANYVEAQSEYTRALYNLIFQEKLLDYYIGKLDENITLN